MTRYRHEIHIDFLQELDLKEFYRQSRQGQAGGKRQAFAAISELAIIAE